MVNLNEKVTIGSVLSYFRCLNCCVLDRNHILQALRQYQPLNEDEKNFIPRFLSLLAHPRAYFRDHLPGHMTGSAWIVDESREFVLLTHHAKLNRWLQPGGHADGDENISGVALREAEEETGIKNFTFLHERIFDIDIHTIPARKDFPEHLHFDVRFLFEATRNEKLLITEESHDLQWVRLDEITKFADNDSIFRMVRKTVS